MGNNILDAPEQPCQDWTSNSISGPGIATLSLGPERRSVVRVVYSDESGLGSERDEPLTVVAGLMLNMDSQWHPVLEAIERGIVDHIGKDDISGYEIKGRSLYHGIRNGNKKSAKLMTSLMGIPSQHHIPVFYGAIDRSGFKYFMRNRHKLRGHSDDQSEQPDPDPHETFLEALKDCISRVDSFVHTVFPREQVLWIHDKGRYDEHAKIGLRDERDFTNANSPWKKLRQEILGIAPIPTVRSHIVETIYFGNSQESRAIQLADVCCSTITRFLRGDSTAAPYYEILRPQVISSDIRPRFEDAERLMTEILKGAKGE